MRNWASSTSARVAVNAGSWIKLATLVAICATVAFTQVRADNPVIYGSAYMGPGGAASLYNINPNTGTATLIGPIGFSQVGAIDFSTSGILYGVGINPANGAQDLITIDPATGTGTAIGPTTLSANVQDIAFRNSDDTLFGYVTGDVYTFNITTGVATELGLL